MTTPTPTPERIAELTAALDNGSYRDVTERVMRAGELRSLLASAGRLVEAERLLDDVEREEGWHLGANLLRRVEAFNEGTPATATEETR